MSAPTPRRRLRRARRRLVLATVLGVTRARLRVLAAVAPGRADRLALDVWCRPPSAGRRRRDLRPSDGVLTRLPVPRGGQALTESWGDADAPVVYLLHGWGGWRGQLGAFVEPLLASGHRVVAVDAPGHGDAGPSFLGRGRGTVMEVDEALRAAVAHHGPAAGVVAHSMGTMVAARAVADGLPVERLVLVAASPPFADVLDQFSRLLQLTPRMREHLQATLEAIVGRVMADFDLVPLAGSAMPPTLVVHDRGDRETPYATAEAVVAGWPDATLLTTEGLGHHRVLADPAVVDGVVAHIRGRVPAA